MSNLDLVPTAATQRGAWVAELIQKSPMPIPKLRKDALREAIRIVQTEEDLKDIFLDTICGSPYFDTSKKQELANVVLEGDWHQLPSLVGVDADFRPEITTTKSCVLSEFKYMAARIFLKSRVMRQLPIQRRQELGAALLACQSKEGLIEMVLQSLEESQLFSDQRRMLIANDLLEGNFHRLLLTDRFDCDRIPRLDTMAEEEEPENCIICFGAYPDGQCCTLSSCGHTFCQDCIQNLRRRLGSPFPCPLCRRDTYSTLE